MDISRSLDITAVLRGKSCFLFGPRQTGKSTLIRMQLAGNPVYDLLDQSLFLRLARNPSLIRQSLEPATTLIIIDEIQKMPELLNEVQLMIEQHAIRFLLTGSSARSLRRKGVNLLGGRARSRNLHPFVRDELGERFSLERAMEFGLIPSIYFSGSPAEDLAAYAGDYLKEEIAAEAAVRNVGAFSRFLEVAALAHGEMINFTNMANDAQVPASTVREYYQILKDTFLAHEVPAFTETRKRKSISTSKCYLFDIGLVRNLQHRRGLASGTPEFGSAFESYIYQEIKAYCDYHLLPTPCYWRSKSQFEVDFIFEDVAVEVKAKSNIGKQDLKGQRALQEEGLMRRHIVVCMEPTARIIAGIEIMPWHVFLDELWDERIAG
jgi:predicted AAA+ superfamily ATPase|tara:strand:+ start:2981 stop:4117 length:1137 start_codon:yes stop_codon:yes gene_type:complete